MRLFDGARQQDRGRRVRATLELAHDVQTRQPGHRQIEEEQVRLGTTNQGDRFLTGARLADDVKPVSDIDTVHLADDAWRHGEQVAQAGAKHRLVVSKGDGDGAITTNGRLPKFDHGVCQ